MVAESGYGRHFDFVIIFINVIFKVDTIANC